MKTVSAGLAAHLASETQTLATCWLVTLVNGGSPIPVYGFTDHNENLVIDAVTYEAATGYTATDIASKSNLDVDNLDIQGLLSSPSITEDDLRAGLWDYAHFQIFQVNYSDLSQGKMYQRVGNLGQITVDREQFRAELLGLMQRYQTSIGEKTSPGCRATLGDSRCGVNLLGSPALTFSATVDSIAADDITITASALTQPSPGIGSPTVAESGYFEYGKLTFTSGLNAGRSMEVKQYAQGVVTLHLPMPYQVTAGDTFNVSAGCDKRLTTCRDKFNNVVNFRGEPWLAGRDKLAQVGRHS